MSISDSPATPLAGADTSVLRSPSNLRLDERIYQDIVARIHGGQLALGEKLPPEIELAEEFKVSRPVIRSALARLRDSGLIISKKGSGSYVSSGHATAHGGYTPLGSIDDIASYFSFRRRIESEAATLAAGRPDANIIEQARLLLTQMEEEIDGGMSTVESDIRFHGLIAEMSGNRFLIESLQMLRSHTICVGKFVRSLDASGYVRGKITMKDEHHQILEAIESKDAELAGRLMDEHLASSVKRVFKGD